MKKIGKSTCTLAFQQECLDDFQNILCFPVFLYQDKRGIQNDATAILGYNDFNNVTIQTQLKNFLHVENKQTIKTISLENGKPQSAFSE